MKNDQGAKRSTASNSNARNTTQHNDGQQKKSSPPLLEKFFMDMLKDIYWAEKHLVETLPILQQAATTDELQDAFEDHLLVTQRQVSRLEKIFRLLGKQPETKRCEAMAGLVEEANSIIKETKEGTMTRDVGLIIAAQKVEHYEIATYGSLVQLARTMEMHDIASLLEKTLWEEEDTDHHLTRIAEFSINPMADEEGNEERNEEDISPERRNGQYATSTASMS
ncbi:MAG: ferritin-like domain-containing protein [Bacteroidota bacterium]